MLFQTLDSKQECIGIYTDQRLFFDEDTFPDNLSATWSYTPRWRDAEIASLYLEGKDVQSVLPEYLKDDWDDILSRLEAFRRYLKTSQVSRAENCFYDLVPDRFLVDYCEVKNRITSYVLKNVKRPLRYGFYHHVAHLLHKIRGQKLLFDHRKIASHNKQGISRIFDAPPHIRYIQFGTKTGRLTTHPESFPILTLKKELRSFVRPVNDMFIEIDFNGCEIRTLLGLLEKSQPEEDVHDFHIQNVFGPNTDRNDAKRLFFAWLYGAKKGISPDHRKQLEKFYSPNSLLQKYWNGQEVVTPYGKKIIDVDKHHALNYLIQSTAAELSLKQFVKVNHYLEQRKAKSFISMILHDSIILDVSTSEMNLMEAICYLVRSTNFGHFRLNVSGGESLDKMEKLNYG
tara:strand:- start:32 stop:1231 length:1200 start_codon:yes stop_codon:yes gene_type:complete